MTLDLLNFLVLTATLISLIYYTFYTKKIHESVFMPFLHVISHDLNLALQPNNVSFKGTLQLVNLGKGPAIDVRIQEMKIGYYTITSKKPFSLIPNQTNYSKLRGDTENLYLTARKLPEVVKESAKILQITCKDQLGKTYTFKYNISNLHIKPTEYMGVES